MGCNILFANCDDEPVYDSFTQEKRDVVVKALRDFARDRVVHDPGTFESDTVLADTLRGIITLASSRYACVESRGLPRAFVDTRSDNVFVRLTDSGRLQVWSEKVQPPRSAEYMEGYTAGYLKGKAEF